MWRWKAAGVAANDSPKPLLFATSKILFILSETHADTHPIMSGRCLIRAYQTKAFRNAAIFVNGMLLRPGVSATSRGGVAYSHSPDKGR